jgi:hypothetical protein
MNLRAAQVRIYADADVLGLRLGLGLGKILADLRNDIIYSGDPGAVIHKRQRPPCPSLILTCSTRTGYRRLAVNWTADRATVLRQHPFRIGHDGSPQVMFPAQNRSLSTSPGGTTVDQSPDLVDLGAAPVL